MGSEIGTGIFKEAEKEMPQGRKVVSEVANKLRNSKGMTLKGYCEQVGLSYSSLRVGFISKKAANQLIMDGLV
jgi:hypothetical protein